MGTKTQKFGNTNCHNVGTIFTPVAQTPMATKILSTSRCAGQFRPFLTQLRGQSGVFLHGPRGYVLLRQQAWKLSPKRRRCLFVGQPLFIQDTGNRRFQLFLIQLLRRRFHRPPFQKSMMRSLIFLIHVKTKPFTQTSNPGCVTLLQNQFATLRIASHPPHIGQFSSQNVAESWRHNKSETGFSARGRPITRNLKTIKRTETLLFPIARANCDNQGRSRQRFTIGYRRSSQNARLLRRVPGADWNRLYSLI